MTDKKRMQFKWMDPHDLVPYEDNPRLNDDAVPFVANSIEDFNFNDPIEVNEDMVILSGHTRLKAAMQLELKEVPVVVISGMSKAEQDAYRIAANKTQEKAGWDFEKLDRQVDDLLDMKMDMSRYGLDLSYLEDRDLEFDAESEEDSEEKDDEEEYTGVVPKEEDVYVKRGDIFLLGSHRLMCGDATSREDMSRLMDGRVADMTFTSPPYNVGYIGRVDKEREGRKYINDEDKRTDEDFFEFLCSNMDLLLEYSREIFYNMGVVSGSKHTIVRLLNKYIDNFKDLLYWEKTNPVPSVAKGVISSGMELIMAFGRNGSRAFEKDIGIYYGVVHGTTVGHNPYREVHRAIFPEYLPKEIISTFTEEGASVLDCFMGTGTTLVACQELGRKGYGMELEPLYVQIAVERYVSMVGGDEDVKVVRDGKVMPLRNLRRT